MVKRDGWYQVEAIRERDVVSVTEKGLAKYLLTKGWRKKLRDVAESLASDLESDERVIIYSSGIGGFFSQTCPEGKNPFFVGRKGNIIYPTIEEFLRKNETSLV